MCAAGEGRQRVGVNGSDSARALAALRRIRQLTCPVCQRAFEGLGRRTYCSPACRTRAYRSRTRAPEVALPGEEANGPRPYRVPVHRQFVLRGRSLAREAHLLVLASRELRARAEALQGRTRQNIAATAARLKQAQSIASALTRSH